MHYQNFFELLLWKHTPWFLDYLGMDSLTLSLFVQLYTAVELSNRRTKTGRTQTDLCAASMFPALKATVTDSVNWTGNSPPHLFMAVVLYQTLTPWTPKAS